MEVPNAIVINSEGQPAVPDGTQILFDLEEAVTPQIALVLTILALAFALLVSERVRMDLVALLVLGLLALTRLVTPVEALSGFSDPAVVTVWAVFILSGGLARTGVAKAIGSQLLRLAGEGELGLVVVIMLSAGLMSSFLNNIGVAALLLPVVMDLARRARRTPSKLLMPLAFGALLGGLTTLIGTPSNILVSDALRDQGLNPFQLFDYAPVGLTVMLSGVAFMALFGRHLLPTRDIAREASSVGKADLNQYYDFRERLFVLTLPENSPLAAKSLAESRIGSALGFNVLCILRRGRTLLAPDPHVTLQAGDKLLVGGRLDHLDQLQGQSFLSLEDEALTLDQLTSAEVNLLEVKLRPGSEVLGKTLPESDFRRRFGVNVLAIRRNGLIQMSELQQTLLQPGDTLLLQGSTAMLNLLHQTPDFTDLKTISDAEAAEAYRLHEGLLLLRVPPDSTLAGKTLAESHLGDAFGLTALVILRADGSHAMPYPQEILLTGDQLLVEGEAKDFRILRGLQNLEVDPEAALDLSSLESDRIGLAEVVLAPHTTLAGKTLRQVHFREKYGMNVLAVWREGRTHRSDLRDLPLRFGDALLLYGPREQLIVLASDPDFLVLTEAAQEPLRVHKAPLAALVMAGVLIPVVLGALPISIAAIIGATAMVLTGCLSMEEAYRFIEWPAVFLIAGMLPLGIALQQSGAAAFVAERVTAIAGGLGPLAVMGGLFILTALTSQVMPNAAVTVIMAPIALSTAAETGISPYSLMMAVAVSASASFLSPVAHPTNSLVMGPGGYRFGDFLKVGLPLTLLVLLTTLLVVPIFWPP